ncbi:MAG TPA: hypothetical protein IAC75_00215, partial [Candidatus Spyradosoma merdigallinarum]|nr:hypothetical protein [Candidatus Spyradosoma merdigallinarum]
MNNSLGFELFMPFLTMTHHEIWMSAREELRRNGHVSSSEFKRCFENIHIREDGDEALTLVAPSDFDAIWLNDNYVSDVEKALFSAAGREVKFRIVGPEDED